MDDDLFEELHGIKEENNQKNEYKNSIESDNYGCVISSSDGLEEKLNQPIILLESDLKFDNFLEFLEYINSNIYLKDVYYCLKIKYNSYYIEWIFRNKEKVFQNIMKTFQLEPLFNFYVSNL